MKLKKENKMFSKSLTAVVFVMASFLPAHAATTSATVWWQPTANAVNFMNVTAPGYSLAMFDVDDFNSTQSNALELNPLVDTIEFAAGGGSDFTVTSTVSNNSITLFDDNNFVLSIYDGSNWIEPELWFEFMPGSNIYSVSFTDSVAFMTNVSPVPLPAALWLFGSGLIGLVAIARRKKIA